MSTYDIQSRGPTIEERLENWVEIPFDWGFQSLMATGQMADADSTLLKGQRSSLLRSNIGRVDLRYT